MCILFNFEGENSSQIFFISMKCGACLREVTVWLFCIPADCSWRTSPELWFFWLQGLECLECDGAKKSLWWVTCSSKVKLKKGLCELPSDLTVFITPLPGGGGGGGGGLVAKSCPAFVTPWSVACQVPLSLGFSRQEFWNGLPFPSPGDLPNPGIEPGSPALLLSYTSP